MRAITLITLFVALTACGDHNGSGENLFIAQIRPITDPNSLIGYYQQTLKGNPEIRAEVVIRFKFEATIVTVSMQCTYNGKAVTVTDSSPYTISDVNSYALKVTNNGTILPSNLSDPLPSTASLKREHDLKASKEIPNANANCAFDFGSNKPWNFSLWNNILAIYDPFRLDLQKIGEI